MMIDEWLLNWLPLSQQMGMSLFNLAYVNNALIDLAAKTCCGKESSSDSQGVTSQEEDKAPKKMTATADSISAKVACDEKLK